MFSTIRAYVTGVHTALFVVGLLVFLSGMWVLGNPGPTNSVSQAFIPAFAQENPGMASASRVVVALTVDLQYPEAITPGEGFMVRADVSLDSVSVTPALYADVYRPLIEEHFSNNGMISLALDLAGADVQPGGSVAVGVEHSVEWSVFVREPGTFTGRVRALDRSGVIEASDDTDAVPFRVEFPPDASLDLTLHAEKTLLDRVLPPITYVLGPLLTLPGLITWGGKLRRRVRHGVQSDTPG
jgi:hypothetical protein